MLKHQKKTVISKYFYKYILQTDLIYFYFKIITNNDSKEEGKKIC